MNLLIRTISLLISFFMLILSLLPYLLLIIWLIILIFIVALVVRTSLLMRWFQIKRWFWYLIWKQSWMAILWSFILIIRSFRLFNFWILILLWLFLFDEINWIFFFFHLCWGWFIFVDGFFIFLFLFVVFLMLCFIRTVLFQWLLIFNMIFINILVSLCLLDSLLIYWFFILLRLFYRFILLFFIFFSFLLNILGLARLLSCFTYYLLCDFHILICLLFECWLGLILNGCLVGCVLISFLSFLLRYLCSDRLGDDSMVGRIRFFNFHFFLLDW